MSRFATLRFDLKANNIKNSGCRLHVPELLRIDSADFSETGLDGDRVLRMNQSINQSINQNQSIITAGFFLLPDIFCLAPR
jgi:hypothetical protein